MSQFNYHFQSSTPEDAGYITVVEKKWTRYRLKGFFMAKGQLPA